MKPSKLTTKSSGLIPTLHQPWYNKGFALDDLGKYDEAIEAYDETIKLDPDHTGAWSNKGIALELLGRTAEAEAAFAKAKGLGYTG